MYTHSGHFKSQHEYSFKWLMEFRCGNKFNVDKHYDYHVPLRSKLLGTNSVVYVLLFGNVESRRQM